MSSSIRFTPLYGVHDTPGSPVCFLLEIDEWRILLDCGWTEAFDPSVLEPLKQIAPSIDAVLLSHPDLQHLGALPYAVAKLGLKCPIYSTLPVSNMGRLFLFDAFHNHRNVEDFTLFSEQDMDAVFDGIHELKYSQRVFLKKSKKSEDEYDEDVAKVMGDLTIVPYAAGHMIGSAMWKICRETDEIVYAMEFNHRKERHLNGANLDVEFLGRPSVLITDAYTSAPHFPPRKTKMDDLISTVLSTIRRPGNVLIPVDTAGRCLELLLALDQCWQSSRLSYPLIFLHNAAKSTKDFAKSQLEWLSDTIQEYFDKNRANYFDLPAVSVCSSLEQMESASRGLPSVVLATSPTLDFGFAQELFIKWCGNARNTVIFTEVSQPGTLSHTLSQQMAQHNAAAGVPMEVAVQVKKKMPLDGADLEQWRKQKKEERDAALKKKEQEALRKKIIRIKDEAAAGAAAAALSASAADSSSHRVLLEAQQEAVEQAARRNRRRLFLPPNLRYSSQFLMFPCIEVNNKWDEYGQVIDAQSFIKAYESSIGQFAADGASASAAGAGGKSTSLLGRREDGIAKRRREDEMQDGPGGGGEEEEKEQIPFKYVQIPTRLLIRCEMHLFDLEARSDSRSVRTILTKLMPRRLILVHGTEEGTNSLLAFCSDKKVAERIAAPKSSMEVVDATLDSNMLHVRIADDVLDSLQFFKFGDFEVAYLEAQLQAVGVTATATASTTTGASAQALAAQVAQAADSPDDTVMEGNDDVQEGEVEKGPTRPNEEEDAVASMKEAMEQEKLVRSEREAAEAAVAASSSSSGGDNVMAVDGASTSKTPALKPSSAIAAMLKKRAARPQLALRPLVGAASAASGASMVSAMSMMMRSSGHKPVYLGDIKLSELREIMLKSGLPCDFQSGSLVYKNGAVVIRKSGTGHISLSGTLCDEYFRIRDILYAQYTVL